MAGPFDNTDENRITWNNSDFGGTSFISRNPENRIPVKFLRWSTGKYGRFCKKQQKHQKGSAVQLYVTPVYALHHHRILSKESSRLNAVLSLAASCRGRYYNYFYRIGSMSI